MRVSTGRAVTGWTARLETGVHNNVPSPAFAHNSYPAFIPDRVPSPTVTPISDPAHSHTLAFIPCFVISPTFLLFLIMLLILLLLLSWLCPFSYLCSYF